MENALNILFANADNPDYGKPKKSKKSSGNNEIPRYFN